MMETRKMGKVRLRRKKNNEIGNKDRRMMPLYDIKKCKHPSRHVDRGYIVAGIDLDQ